MWPNPWFFPFLVALLQTVALFTPYFSQMFSRGGLSAVFFTVALITAHLAMFWKGLKPIHALSSIPVQGAIQFSALLIFNIVFPRTASVLPDGGYDGFMRSILIQSPILIVVAIGLWVGIKFDRYIYRRAALDHDEQMKLYRFRMNDAGDSENDFFKYSILLGRSLTIVCSRKNKIFGCISGLRLDNTLYLYDHYIDPDSTEPDMERQLVAKLVNRSDILTTPINKIVASVRESGKNLVSGYESLGFKTIGNDEKIREIQDRLDNILKHKYDDYRPFHNVSFFMEYDLPSD